MRILFVARALNAMAGGVERMIIALMNEMALRAHTVGLFSWDRDDARAFYPINGEIPWFKLDMGEPSRKARAREVMQRLPVIRRIVRTFAPDVIVCFQGGPFMAMRAFTAGMGIPVIAAERTSPTLYEHAGTRRWQFLERQAFRTARLITVQVERYRSLYPDYLRTKIVTVPNPVSPARILASPAGEGENGRLRLLSVGRLSYQKNYGVLIDAFAALAPQFPDWDLRIVGEGANRTSLETQIGSEPALMQRVSLPGARSDIESEYAAAHLFCLPARWEGFPNALAEAMAHGLPSVGFAGCAGVGDLIVPGESGALAAGNNDSDSLAAALAPLMADASLRARMGQVATQSMQAFEPRKIFDMWEETLQIAVEAH